MAGLLYAGSGVVLTTLRLVRPQVRARLSGSEKRYLAGAVISGGIIGPVLLMKGLAGMSAAGASLLLNAEGVLTAMLAWFVFRENVDKRVAFGMFAIAGGAVLLTWTPGTQISELLPALLVLGACGAWAIDNNLTRKVSLNDAVWIASLKGLVAGTVNLSIASLVGVSWPSVPAILGALVIGAFAYGLSLVLFVSGLRNLGAARTTAYFSAGPFVGAVFALVWLHEPLSIRLVIAFALMALGMWLHLTERHEHFHHHEALEHEHEHEHDEHHQHDHPPGTVSAARHRHRHRHEPLAHAHHHFPDSHHQHGHD